VLEVPNSALGSKKMGLWVRTLDGGKREMGSGGSRCAIKSNSLPCWRAERCLSSCGAAGRCAFHPSPSRTPLEHTGGYTPAEAMRVAGTLLPDVLTMIPLGRASYPDNAGHSPTTSVDFFLPLLTKWKGDARQCGAPQRPGSPCSLRGPAAQGPIRGSVRGLLSAGGRGAERSGESRG